MVANVATLAQGLPRGMMETEPVFDGYYCNSVLATESLALNTDSGSMSWPTLFP